MNIQGWKNLVVIWIGYLNTFIMNITLLEIYFSIGSKDKTLLHEVLIYISA